MTAERPADPSPKDFAGWIRPRDALTPLQSLGVDAATSEIYRRLKSGMLWAAGSVGETASYRAHDDPRSVIPALWWGQAETVATPNHVLWRTGGLTLTIVSSTSTDDNLLFHTYEHFGVRFEPEGLQRLADDVGLHAAFSSRMRLAEALVAPQAPERALLNLDSLPSKGGRPRAEFWDDMLIAVAKAIYDGDLKPRNQADVTRAMQDWVADHGYEGGLTQIKAAAAKVFKAFQ